MRKLEGLIRNNQRGSKSSLLGIAMVVLLGIGYYGYEYWKESLAKEAERISNQAQQLERNYSYLRGLCRVDLPASLHECQKIVKQADHIENFSSSLHESWRKSLQDGQPFHGLLSLQQRIEQHNKWSPVAQDLQERAQNHGFSFSWLVPPYFQNQVERALSIIEQHEQELKPMQALIEDAAENSIQLKIDPPYWPSTRIAFLEFLPLADHIASMEERAKILKIESLSFQKTFEVTSHTQVASDIDNSVLQSIKNSWLLNMLKIRRLEECTLLKSIAMEKGLQWSVDASRRCITQSTKVKESGQVRSPMFEQGLYSTLDLGLAYSQKRLLEVEGTSQGSFLFGMEYAAKLLNKKVPSSLYKQLALKLFDQALQVTKTISTFVSSLVSSDNRTKGYYQDIALQSIALELVKIKHFDQAQQLISKISRKRVKSRALSLFAIELTKAKQKAKASTIFNQAIKEANGISKSEDKASALASIISELAKSQRFDQALQVANTISIHYAKASALASIISELAKSQRFNQALQVVKICEDNHTRFSALGSIALELAKSQRFDQALQAANEIPSSNQYNAKMLAAIAAEMAINQQIELASTTFDQALQVVQNEKTLYNKSNVLEFIAAQLAKGQQFERALDVAGLISDHHSKSSAFVSISSELAKSQRFDQALQAANTISISYYEASALGSIALELAKSQRFDQALQVANTISENDDKARLLSAIATALAKNQQSELANTTFERAIKVAKGIPDNEDRSRELGAIVSELVKSQRFDQAFQVVNDMSNYHYKATAIALIGSELMQNHAKVGSISTMKKKYPKTTPIPSFEPFLSAVVLPADITMWPPPAIAAEQEQEIPVTQENQLFLSDMKWIVSATPISQLQKDYKNLITKLKNAGFHRIAQDLTCTQDEVDLPLSESSLSNLSTQLLLWHQGQRLRKKHRAQGGNPLEDLDKWMGKISYSTHCPASLPIRNLSSKALQALEAELKKQLFGIDYASVQSKAKAAKDPKVKMSLEDYIDSKINNWNTAKDMEWNLDQEPKPTFKDSGIEVTESTFEALVIAFRSR